MARGGDAKMGGIVYLQRPLISIQMYWSLPRDSWLIFPAWRDRERVKNATTCAILHCIRKITWRISEKRGKGDGKEV